MKPILIALIGLLALSGCAGHYCKSASNKEACKARYYENVSQSLNKFNNTLGGMSSCMYEAEAGAKTITSYNCNGQIYNPTQYGAQVSANCAPIYYVDPIRQNQLYNQCTARQAK